MGSGMVRFLMAVMSGAGLVVLGCLIWAVGYGTHTDVVVISMLLVAVVTVILTVGITTVKDNKKEDKQ